MSATPSLTSGSSRESRISTTCANAGRRRCGRLTPAFPVRPTRTSAEGAAEIGVGHCKRLVFDECLSREEDPLMAALQKVAVVTGAGTGIGKAVALALMKEGYAAVFAGRRKDKLEEAASGASRAAQKASSFPPT